MASALRILLTLALGAAGWQMIGPTAAAELARRADSIAALERALRWDPLNPELHFGLGVAHRDALLARDLDTALRYLRRAVELHPFQPRFRSELAAAHELAGDRELAEAALRESIALSPRRPVYRWRLANLYLRAGEPDAALPLLAELLAEDPALRPPGLTLLLQAGIGAAELDRLWPADAAARKDLLRRLLRYPGAADSGVVTHLLALQWQRLMAEPEPLTMAEGEPYVRLLLDAGRFGDARRRWLELAGRNGLDDDGYAAGRNAVWNGGFELPSAGGPLDWRLGCGAGYCMEITSEEGGAALRVDLSGEENLRLDHLLQRVIVEPGAGYELTLRARWLGITTDEGLSLRIATGAGEPVFESPTFLGDGPWRTYSGRLTVPAGVESLDLRLRRRPSRRLGGRIAGDLWLDEVALTVIR